MAFLLLVLPKIIKKKRQSRTKKHSKIWTVIQTILGLRTP